MQMSRVNREMGYCRQEVRWPWNGHAIFVSILMQIFPVFRNLVILLFSEIVIFMRTEWSPIQYVIIQPKWLKKLDDREAGVG